MENVISKKLKYPDDFINKIIHGDCLEVIKDIPDKSVQLIFTSPPYNMANKNNMVLDIFYNQQFLVIMECTRILSNNGSICWQLENYADKSVVTPLDIILYPIFIELGYKMRNRIVWSFDSGMNHKRRFNIRHETIIWFTKIDDYIFNGGRFEEKKLGDVWKFSNPKYDRLEKVEHACKFSIDIVEKFILNTTNENDLVFDPFVGSGTTAIASLKNNRKYIGIDINEEYCNLARNKLKIGECCNE